MTDIKSLKSIDLSSITIMGTAINFIWGIILGISVMLILAISSSMINMSLLMILFAIAFMALVISIPKYFGVSFLYNNLITRLKDVKVKIIDMEKITNVSILSTSLIISLISLIMILIMYPILFIGFSITATALIAFIPILQLILNPLMILLVFLALYIFSAIGIFIFNNIAPKIGGIEVSLSQVGNMVALDSINPKNVAIISGIICLVMGLIIGLVISILVGNLPASLTLILTLVVGGFFGGGIYGALSSILYNFFAPKLGSVKLDLEDSE